ncbi:recombinase family protein [Marinomonas lutimaris]|uniref:recombinase family protein n=1 Tax=Marinomonas lutimaris TaxID=2846746 RepID=UPI001CA57398
MSHLIGYARVSTIAQSLSSQFTVLESAGFQKIFSGKYSGSSKDNDVQLQSLIDYMRDDDVCRNIARQAWSFPKSYFENHR